MRFAGAVVSFVLISSHVAYAAELFQERSIPISPAVPLSVPLQDDRPLAEVLSDKLYIYSTSIKLNCKAGLSWMTQLAEAGNAQAMFELGDLYDTGNCVQASQPKALAWFVKAAENGSANAASALGKLYLGSQDVAPDYRRALQLVVAGRDPAQQSCLLLLRFDV